MKRILIITASILLLATTACNEDWLTLDPQGQKLENNFYQSEEEIFQGLVSAYSMLQTKYFSGWSSYYFLRNFPSDDAHVVGGGPGDRPEYTAIGNFNTKSTNTAVLQMWRRNFYGINRANVVIANANPDASATSAEYVAEARFLRAYYYFELVRMFGDLPLLTGTLGRDEYNQERNPAEKVFQQIIKDLENAIDVLAVKPALGANEMYRATKGAGQALLGKVYLYMASPYYQNEYDFEQSSEAYYQLAADYFKDVIDTQNYDLFDNYDDIWKLHAAHGIESIFEIEYANIAQGYAWENGRFNGGNVDVQMSGPRGISTDTLNAGWGFDMVTQDLITTYEAEGDSARKYGTAYGEDFLNEIGASDWEKNAGYTGWFNKKHAPWSHLTSDVGEDFNYATNERMIRYADVLLMYAEALLQSGSGDPLPHVNKVRERAGLDPLGSVTMEDIKKERRLELAMEGHRFFDLVRWGDAAQVLGEHGFVEGTHEKFPIPQEEIDNSSGLLDQNNGY